MASKSMKIDPVPYNAIRLRVEKPLELDKDGVYSETKEIHGFPWRFHVTRSHHIYVGLYCCKSEKSVHWKCTASMDVLLIKQTEGGNNYEVPWFASNDFTPEKSYEGLSVFVMAHIVQNEQFGYRKDDSIIIEVRVDVRGQSGSRFRNKIEYDMFSPSHKSDAILFVEGKKLYVSKQLLAIQSSFFDRLFYGDFKESKETEIAIGDVSLKEFVVLLKMIYRTSNSFSPDNVEFLLNLADRFRMDRILDDAELFLLSSEKPDIHRKFRLADQYKLHVLQDSLLPKYTAILLQTLKQSEEYRYLREETKDLVFDKFIELNPAK